jgi:hypothetical protein
VLGSLEKTLKSVRSVAYTYNDFNFHTIIINGNPNDKAYLIAKEYSELVYKYVAESDTGIYDAMNKGISYLPVNGYSIFINSDDELLHIPDIIGKNSFDVIFCDVVSYDEAASLKEVFHVFKKNKLDSKNLLRPRIHHQGCFTKNQVLKLYQYNLNVGIRADVLLMGILLNNHKTFFSTDVVAMITTGGASDNYTFSNIFSFFLVADELKINRILIFVFSFPELFKYTIKSLIGKKGIFVVRKLKSYVLKKINFN